MRPSPITWLFSHIGWFSKRWARHFRAVEHSDVPWTPMTRPLSKCRIALVSTSGVHLATQPPFDLADPHGDPSYRVLPARLEPGGYTVSHNSYDYRDVIEDSNIVLPLDRLAELAATGEIGSVASHHYSFMGHIVKEHIPTLIEKMAPEVAARLRQEAVDAVVMTPA